MNLCLLLIVSTNELNVYYILINLFWTTNVENIFLILQGAITKRMTAIEELAGMDVLCSDKTGTLTLNKLSVDKNLIEVRTGIKQHGYQILVIV